MTKVASSLLIALGILTYTAYAKVDADEVTSLPDCGPLPSKWYSGYLDASDTKKLHYVYI